MREDRAYTTFAGETDKGFELGFGELLGIGGGKECGVPLKK